jgi:DNA adenine methylase
VQYLGGKQRIARSIARVVLATTDRRSRYVEPFLGGGSVMRALAPHFADAVAGDWSEDVCLLWQAVRDGWEPPTSVTEAEYEALRRSPPSALRGFVGFGCSFGGKFFGGFARGSRNYASLSAAPVERARGAASSLRLVARRDYGDWDGEVGPDSVVYCDAPYAETTGYASSRGGFCHDRFWRTCDAWVDRGAHVYVSEQRGPAHWNILWEHPHRKRVAGCTGVLTDHLFARHTDARPRVDY